MMKKIGIALLVLLSAGLVFAQELDTPDPERIGVVAGQQKIKYVSIDKFETEGTWNVYMSSDEGVIKGRLFEGSPKDKEPIEDETGFNIPDEHVLGVRVDYFRRGYNSFTITPVRPLPVPGITKDVTDAAILLNLIAGHDEKDSTSLKLEKKDYTLSLKNDVKGMKIGIPKEYIGEGINEEVKSAILEVAKKYEEMGAIVEECSLDVGKYATAVYYIIACAEASSNLGRFDGIRYGYRSENFENLKDIYKNSRSEGFGPEVKRRIILGTYVLSSGYYDAYYKKAQKVRTVIKNAYNELFQKYDLLLTPTSPTTAFKIGEKSNNPLEMYLADICTVPVNIAGLPGMSIPCSLDSKGLPIGFQLISNSFQEEKIFRAAYSYEQNSNFKANEPTFKKGGDK